MNCDNCGACCRWIMFPFCEELREVSLARGTTIIGFKRKLFFAFRIECRHLNKEGRCRIYPTRFDYCRNNPKEGDGICEMTRRLEERVKSLV